MPGGISHTVELAKPFIERTKTAAGLRVPVSILDEVYATGRKYAEGFQENMTIVFDDHRPKRNYRARTHIGK